jgi:hypothetical protein
LYTINDCYKEYSRNGHKEQYVSQDGSWGLEHKELMKMTPSSGRFALMMEAARTSETLTNVYQTTRSYNPEDSHLHTCRRKNLNSYKELMFTHFKIMFAVNLVRIAELSGCAMGAIPTTHTIVLGLSRKLVVECFHEDGFECGMKTRRRHSLL